MFRPSRSKNTLLWSLTLLAIIDAPLLLILILSSQGSLFFVLVFGCIIALIDSLIFSLGFLGERMRYILQEGEFIIDFGFLKRRIAYSAIKEVRISHTALVLRIFGASWPGLHWGLYRAQDVGSVWVYSNKMAGDFVLIELVNGKKVAVSPEDPKALLDVLESKNVRFGTLSPNEVEGFEASKRYIYLQIAIVAAAFLAFLGYVLWIYHSLPDIIPVHFDLNWNPNRWAHKSELFLMVGIAGIFPVINTVLAAKYGRFGKELTLFLGVVFTLVMALFFWIVFFIQSVV